LSEEDRLIYSISRRTTKISDNPTGLTEEEEEEEEEKEKEKGKDNKMVISTFGLLGVGITVINGEVIPVENVPPHPPPLPGRKRIKT
jgi:hypothetical protein